MLVFKKDKVIEYVIAWKSKGLFKTELYPLHNVFLPNVKRFGYTIGIQFNKTALVIDKNNYMSKLGKVYIFYHLNYWPRNLFNNLVLKIACLVQLI